MSEYIIYQEKFGHSRLDKWNRIWSPPKNKIFGYLNEEIFNGLETKYDIIENDLNYLVRFITISGTEYRFDLLNEPKKKIYHLAFSLFSNEIGNDIEYHRHTDKGESLELMNRLIFILKDLSDRIEVEYYCIGLTGNKKKDNIYEYMMRFLSGWEKKQTAHYETGWGIYFNI